MLGKKVTKLKQTKIERDVKIIITSFCMLKKPRLHRKKKKKKSLGKD